VTSLDVDLRKWKTATYLWIGCRFEDWTSIRDWTSIWVLHIFNTLFYLVDFISFNDRWATPFFCES